jgi:hypothetical protein
LPSTASHPISVPSYSHSLPSKPLDVPPHPNVDLRRFPSPPPKPFQQRRIEPVQLWVGRLKIGTTGQEIAEMFRREGIEPLDAVVKTRVRLFSFSTAPSSAPTHSPIRFRSSNPATPLSPSNHFSPPTSPSPASILTVSTAFASSSTSPLPIPVSAAHLDHSLQSATSPLRSRPASFLPSFSLTKRTQASSTVAASGKRARGASWSRM